MGKFRRLAQTNRRSKQILYSIPTEGDWFGDMVYSTGLKAIVPPPKWKMAIVAFIGAYCISLLASFILRSFLGLQPLLFNLFMNIILVIGLTYFAMPLLSRLLRRWLYPKSL